MPTYRVYLLDTSGKIKWGDWIEANDQSEAEAKAHALCDSGSPIVELWQGPRRLAEIPCDASANDQPKTRPRRGRSAR